MIFFQLWVLSWFLTVIIFNLFFGWKMYYPMWARKPETFIYYRYLLMLLAPFSWIYVAATYRKRNEHV